MDFPLHKEWMGEKYKLSNKHTSGVFEFIEFAKKNKNPLDNKILCPCSICKNRKHQTLEEVEYHLIRRGMILEYTLWTFHGETQETLYVPEVIERNEVEDHYDFTSHRLNDLIDDVYENFFALHTDMPIRIEEASSSTNVNGASFEPDSEYIRLKTEASKPLFPNCKGSTPPKPKIVIGFDANENIIKNKNALQEVTREILHSQFSVGVNGWKDVDSDTRKDLWNTLKTQFEMDDIHKDTVMSMMGAQLRNFRCRVSNTELTDLSAAEIVKRKDDPHDFIQLTQWNKFIEREATEAKMAERLQNADSRAKLDDVHCLGKKSYAQLSADLSAKGIEHDRPMLYGLACTQTNSEITPGAVNNVSKLHEFELTQDPTDRHDIRLDALARCRGPDKKERVRAVSCRTSKQKYIGMQTVKKFF